MLIDNYEKKKTVAILKKSYSELNQALMMAERGNGLISNYQGADNIALWVQNYIEPYVRYEKAVECRQNTEQPCGGINRFYVLQSRRERDKSSGYMLVHPGAAAAWKFYWHAYGSFNVRIYVNNPKNPELGKNVFTFVLEPSKYTTFKPFGLVGTVPYTTGSIPRDKLLKGPIRTGGCFKESGGPDYYGPGDGCAAVIMLDGWNIAKDYPW